MKNILPGHLHDTYDEKYKSILTYTLLVFLTIVALFSFSPESRLIDEANLYKSPEVSFSNSLTQKEIELYKITTSDGIDLFNSESENKDEISTKLGDFENILDETSEYIFIMILIAIMTIFVTAILSELIDVLRKFDSPPESLPKEENVFKILFAVYLILLSFSGLYFNIAWRYISDYSELKNAFHYISLGPFIFMGLLIFLLVPAINILSNESNNQVKED